jgi:hypothetical protein
VQEVTHTHTHHTFHIFHTLYNYTDINLFDWYENEWVCEDVKEERESVTQTDESTYNQTNCESTLNRLKLKKSHTRHIQLNMLDWSIVWLFDCLLNGYIYDVFLCSPTNTHTIQEDWMNCCFDVEINQSMMRRKLNWFEELQEECFIFTNTTSFIVILLPGTFYWQRMENPKSQYFIFFLQYHLTHRYTHTHTHTLKHIHLSSIESIHIWTRNKSHYKNKWIETYEELIDCLINICGNWTEMNWNGIYLGFWNVSNSWTSRRRKGEWEMFSIWFRIESDWNVFKLSVLSVECDCECVWERERERERERENNIIIIIVVIDFDSKSNWIELNWIELNWIELNWIELNWIRSIECCFVRWWR